MPSDFINELLKVTDASECKEVEVIQSLWSGYGKISRYELINSPHKTVVVKSISLNQVINHPRGWNTDSSHNRKVKSYEVETYWYEHWNQLCNANCKTPNFIGSFSEGKDQWIILEDLNSNYPKRKESLSFSEVKNCLKWLANFHGTFLNHDPKELWQVGTYWHLGTRPDELEKIEDPEIKTKAHKMDALLTACKYQTIVHGDAKLANFCFSENGTEVSAVDFQYVGGGCGMKDVVYFLGSCLGGKELELYENDLLNYYFSELKKARNTTKIDFNELEVEWRRLYPVASADFTRFLLGWMPSHQKINTYNLEIMARVIAVL
jgi:hypothetical protein